MMNLPLVVGQTSANDDCVVDFISLPNLFVSYTSETQADDFFESLIKSIINKKSSQRIELAVAASRTNWFQSGTKDLLSYAKHRFIIGDVYRSNLNSRQQFFSTLSKEIRRRLKVLNKAKEKQSLPANNMVESPLNSFAYLIVYLDEVFDIILNNTKAIGLTFLQLLLFGKELKIHLIAASYSTYRNLLKQLMTLDPVAKAKLNKHSITQEFQVATPLGAELVITAEDFMFFKEANTKEYKRLFPKVKGTIAQPLTISLYE